MSRWPDVYAGLLTLLPRALGSGVVVFDGQPVTNDNPSDWVTVGFVADDTAGSFTQSRDPSGVAMQELGDVKCHLAVNDGGTDPSVSRNRAFGYVDSLQAALSADQTLGGVLGADSTLELTVEVLGIQSGVGSAASLLLTVRYWTNTYS